MKTYPVYAAPRGHTFENCTVVITAGHCEFFKPASNPSVFHSGRKDLDMTNKYNVNDNDRRAYCKLTGIKMAEIKATMKANDEAYRKAEGKRTVAKLRQQAANMGYRIVKK